MVGPGGRGSSFEWRRLARRPVAVAALWALGSGFAMGCGNSSVGAHADGAAGSGGREGSAGIAGSAGDAASGGNAGSNASAGSGGGGGSGGDAAGIGGSGGGAGSSANAGTAGNAGATASGGSGGNAAAGSDGAGSGGASPDGGAGSGSSVGVSGTGGGAGGAIVDPGGGCVIGGSIYAANVLNPIDACQGCQPGMSTSSWTNATDGSGCGSGKVCSSGACYSGCFIGGTFYDPGHGNPLDVTCGTCQPASSVSAWTAAAEGTYCGGGKVCHAGACTNGCGIGGSYYAPGDANPSVACQSCQPSMALTMWSTSPNGTGCGAGGQICNAGACKSGCYVGGSFYSPGNYGCQQCAPATSTSSLGESPEGTSCGTLSVCHNSACTIGCYVGGSYFAQNAVNPGEPCQKCVPYMTTSAWSAFADGTSCATGRVCKAAACTAGCYMLGAYEAPNTVSGGACQSCQPTASTSAWSNLADGTSCGGSTCGDGACVATTWSHSYFDYVATMGGAISMRQTSDSGYLVVVDQSSVVDTSSGVAQTIPLGPVLLKLDVNGAILWGRRFPPPKFGMPVQTAPLAGVSARELGGAYYFLLHESILAKFDTTGAFQWAKSYPGLLFTSLDVTASGQLLLGADQAPSAVIATYVLVDGTGAVQKSGYVNGTVGFGALADQAGNVLLFGNQQDPNGSVPWAGRVDPTGPSLLSQLHFQYPAYNASDGQIVAAAETSPGAYAFAGVQTLYYPASSLNGRDHPFVWASGTDLTIATWSTEFLPEFELDGLAAVAGGGVAIIGAQVKGGLTSNSTFLELGSTGAVVQASAYTNTGTPSFASISATSTPGFAIGGTQSGGTLAMSTKTDGTIAGTCDQGFGSSITVTPQNFGLLTNAGVLKVNSMVVTPATATLTTVSTDGFTLTAHCRP